MFLLNKIAWLTLSLEEMVTELLSNGYISYELYEYTLNNIRMNENKCNIFLQLIIQFNSKYVLSSIDTK